MLPSVKILLIEDNAEIQEAICLIFQLHWPEAKIINAFDGSHGIALSKTESPDLVILDLGLPDLDGLRVLKEIRDFSQVPVIILTVRGEGMDKVRGFELGADDYIVKPFSYQEILARVQTVLQLDRMTTEEQVDEVKQPGASQNISIDFNSGIITKGDMQFKLTNTELNLLKYMASNNGRILTDNEILARVWGDEYVDCTEYLQSYMHGLREKLEEDPHNPKIILSEQVGYKFILPAV